MKNLDSRVKVIIACLLVGILFYLLGQYSISVGDDYYYAFTHYCPINHRIESLSDIIQNQINTYLYGTDHNSNGRIIIHSIVHFFCGVAGMSVFRVVNVFVFVLETILVYRLVSQRRGWYYYMVTVFLLFVLISYQASTVMGSIAFTVNYLWGAVFALLFLSLYNYVRKSHEVPIWSNCLFFIIAVLCGSTQESFSVCIGGALVIHLFFQWKETSKSTKLLILGYVIGVVIVSLAPATLQRFLIVSSSSYGNNFATACVERCSQVLLRAKSFDILLCLLGYKLIFKRQEICDFIKRNAILLLAIGISLCFMVFIAYQGRHQLYCAELLSVVVLGRYVFRFYGDFMERRKRLVAGLITICALCLYIPIFCARKMVYDAQMDFINNAKKTKTGCVVSKTYENLCCEKKKPIIDNYLVRSSYIGLDRKGLSMYLFNDSNHIQTIIPDEPESIVNQCKKENQSDMGKDIYLMENRHFYIIQMDGAVNFDSVKIKTTESKKDFLINIYAVLFPSSPFLVKSETTLNKYMYGHFVYGNKSYIVVRNTEDRPLQSITVLREW